MKRHTRWAVLGGVLLLYPVTAYRGFDWAADRILWDLSGRPGATDTFMGDPLPKPDRARPLVKSATAHVAASHAPLPAGVRTFHIVAQQAGADACRIGWRAARVTRSHTGQLAVFTGTIHLIDGAPEASRVEVQFQMRSILGDVASLTMHLQTNSFFNVPQHPTGAFTSTQITKDGDSYAVAGNLELRGRTRSVTFPASIKVADDRVTVNAEFFIDRQDWGIAFPGFGDDIIRDEVLIQLHIVGLPAETPAPAA